MPPSDDSLRQSGAYAVGMPQASWDEHRDRWQALTNAVEIPQRSAQRDLDPYVPVRARLVWERDGPEERETIAVAWAGRAVLVEVNDLRVLVRWAWFDASDVQRLTPERPP